MNADRSVDRTVHVWYSRTYVSDEARTVFLREFIITSIVLKHNHFNVTTIEGVKCKLFEDDTIP